MESSQSILSLLEGLTGQSAPIPLLIPEKDISEVIENEGIGYTQFNELLLTIGYDRVERDLFDFLAVDDEKKLLEDSNSDGYKITSIKQFANGVERLQRYSLLLYGNIKFGFKVLSSKGNQLREAIMNNQPINENHYSKRNSQIFNIQKIAPEHTYYLGYLIRNEIKIRLRNDKTDPEANRENQICQEITKKGKLNNISYLTSDHLDVYIATSMRLRHEYMLISRLAEKIFQNKELKHLNLRWFDPTQAYCKDRIDKGLVEGLMLRRAKCTIYLVQETDTLGKDSELASTLAQGKTVIAYVPRVDTAFFNEYFQDLKSIDPKKSDDIIIKEQLKIISPNLAWDDESIREWLTNPSNSGSINPKKLLEDALAKHYDSRAETLCDKHPLGIQVNIATGVANGVLVVRDVESCARLVKCVLLQRMEFIIDKGEILPDEIDSREYENDIINKITSKDNREIFDKSYSKNDDGKKYILNDSIEDVDEQVILGVLRSIGTCLKKHYYLREKISNCIYRVMTGDTLLTNSFWNFYLH